jgi:hypothetical protein
VRFFAQRPHDDDQVANILKRCNVDPSVLYRTGLHSERGDGALRRGQKRSTMVNRNPLLSLLLNPEPL